MARLAAVLVVLGTIAQLGCGGSDRFAVSADTTAGPEGTLVLRNVGGQSLTLVDVARGTTATIPIAELAPGDPLHHLFETGGKLVFWGAGGTYAIDPSLAGPPQKLGEASWFVPSATEGRVWLALVDPESRRMVVREVTVTGQVIVPDAQPPPSCASSVLAAVKAGVLCQDGGLRVWDPASGKAILELPGPFVVDTHENLIAWCGRGCPRLHVTDVRTRADVAVSAAESFAFEETYDGAFSPDGSLLAVPVVTEGADRPHMAGHRHGVALVGVEAGTARLVEGSELDGDYPAMAWSHSGDWLFFSAGEGRIMAYRRGSEKAVLLPIEVGQSFVEMAIG